MEIEVRRIGAGDGARLRAVRLAALAEAPGAFWQTLAGEAARPSADWDRRAARGSAGDAQATFLLAHGDERSSKPGSERRSEPGDERRGERRGERGRERGGETVGMVNVHRPVHAPDFRELAAMWVAPSARGTGAAGLLLTTALDWARSAGAIGVRLWVEASNPVAQRLYLRHGFARIGRPGRGERDDDRDGGRDVEPAEKSYLLMALAFDAGAAASGTFLDHATAPWTDESD